MNVSLSARVACLQLECRAIGESRFAFATAVAVVAANLPTTELPSIRKIDASTDDSPRLLASHPMRRPPGRRNRRRHRPRRRQILDLENATGGQLEAPVAAMISDDEPGRRIVQPVIGEVDRAPLPPVIAHEAGRCRLHCQYQVAAAFERRGWWRSDRQSSCRQR